MPTPSNLVSKLAGLAAILGGALWAAKAFYDRNDAPPWPTDVTDTLLFVVPLLLAGGFAGLYARCRGRLGDDWGPVAFGSFFVGAAGFVASAAGLPVATFAAWPAWVLDISWWLFLFGFFMGNLGLVFFGAAVLQSWALPQPKGLPLALGALGILLIPVSDPPNSELGVYPALVLWMLYGFGWAALGFFVLAGGRPATRRSTTPGEPEASV